MNSRKPIVWVMKEQVRRGATGPEPMDYTPAMKYGEVRFITDFDLPLHQGGSLVGSWWNAVHDFIEEFDPTIDFLVPTGQPLAMVLIGAAIGNAYTGNLQFLVWRREDNKYVPYTSAETPITA